jgi:tetratricopeptide (TPR) repeat protein
MRLIKKKNLSQTPPNNYLEKGIHQFKMGRYAEALSSFLSVRGDAGDYPELPYYLGLCYAQLEKYDEAILYLEQVISSGKDILHSYQSRMLAGYIYAITERLELSSYEFDKLLEEGYRSASVFSALAFTQFKQNKIEDSIDSLKTALEMEPGNPNALNSMGFILADSDTDPAGGVEYCKRALGFKPDNPAYLDSLGWALYKMGNLPEAIKILKKALAISPDESEIKDHLRKVISSQGNK